MQEKITQTFLTNEKKRVNSNSYPYIDARLTYGPKPENRRLLEKQESIVYVKGNIRFSNGENGPISADERPFMFIYAVFMVSFGILLIIWSKILKAFEYVPSNMNVALHVILIMCTFETSLNFIYFSMKNSVPNFQGNQLLITIIILEFFRSAVSRCFLFLTAV